MTGFTSSTSIDFDFEGSIVFSCDLGIEERDGLVNLRLIGKFDTDCRVDTIELDSEGVTLILSLISFRKNP